MLPIYVFGCVRLRIVHNFIAHLNLNCMPKTNFIGGLKASMNLTNGLAEQPSKIFECLMLGSRKDYKGGLRPYIKISAWYMNELKHQCCQSALKKFLWLVFYMQVLLLSLVLSLSPVSEGAAAAPGWSIWSGGRWIIPDDDEDNIPGKTPITIATWVKPYNLSCAGIAGIDYPVKGQKELCALNPTNPGC